MRLVWQKEKTKNKTENQNVLSLKLIRSFELCYLLLSVLPKQCAGFKLAKHTLWYSQSLIYISPFVLSGHRQECKINLNISPLARHRLNILNFHTIHKTFHISQSSHPALCTSACTVLSVHCTFGCSVCLHWCAVYACGVQCCVLR